MRQKRPYLSIKDIRQLNSKLNDEIEDDDDSEYYGDIETVDNHIYFYADIERPTIFKLIKQLRALDKKLQLQSQEHAIKFGMDPVPIPIHLHIHSNGGDIHASFSAADALRATKNPVYTYVEGTSASGGTIISIVGKRRFIQKHSFMLIHQLSSWVAGNMREIEDEAESLQKFMVNLRKHYRKFTKLDEEAIEKLLRRDLWLTAKECVEMGLVDEIYE